MLCCYSWRHVHCQIPLCNPRLCCPACLQSLNCAEVVLSTLSLAVEWLLQAPQEARQGAMLCATQLLLAFTLSPYPQPSSSSRSGSQLASPLESGLAAAAGAGEPPRTPVATLLGAGPAAQHRLAGQSPTPLHLPASPAGGSPEPGSLPALSPALAQRPVSPSLAALQAAAAAASEAATPAAAAQPATPRAVSFDRLQGAAESAAAASDSLPAPTAELSAGDRLEAAAAGAAEASATLLWSFLNGRAMVAPGLLRLVPPLLLRALFEDLRPDSSGRHYEALAAAGAGAPASRLTKAADLALGVQAAVQVGGRVQLAGCLVVANGRLMAELLAGGLSRGLLLLGLHACGWEEAVTADCQVCPPPPCRHLQADRPLWDARAAVLLLLMGRCASDAAALQALGGVAFFSGLLSEPDARVRHYAAVFVLRQLMLQQPQQYRCGGWASGRAWSPPMHA